ncbi:MAG: iron-containing alcohol dehydrogenase [Bacteroides sp.]
MNNFVFYSPTEFVFGKDTESQVGAMARKYGARKVMIVYGGGSVVRSGLLERVKTSLQEAGIAFCELGGVQPNPIDLKVYEGIELCRKEEADLLLAVGGGSTIDTAKAIACGALYEGDFWDFFIGKAVIEKALKVAVVLTIPAAGSEGSGNSVITKTETLQKLGMGSNKLRPLFSILNPQLTCTLPPYQTASGVADMMAHIMERYFTNTREVEISDRLCEGVLKAIIEEAPKVIKNPNDYEARANIMWSGMVAHNGTCGVGREEDWSSHALEHEISAIYNVTHGAGLAVVFPAWLTWMVTHNVDKLVQYAVRVWDVPVPAGKQLSDEEKVAVATEGIRRLKAFFTSLGLPVSFAELHIEHPDIPRMIESLRRNKGNLLGCYVKLTMEDCADIYRLAL